MKTGVIVLLMAIATLNASAQKLTPAKVPAAVKSAFAKAHPSSNATWEKEDGNYEAVYKDGGKEASCVIDSKGNILETETPIRLSQMPATAVAYVRQHHKSARIQETARIEKASGEVVYEIAISGKDILFDKNGKLLKSAKD